MVSQKLSQMYKQYPGSFLSLPVVLYESRYDQYYFWYIRSSTTDPSTLNIDMYNMYTTDGLYSWRHVKAFVSMMKNIISISLVCFLEFYVTSKQIWLTTNIS